MALRPPARPSWRTRTIVAALALMLGAALFAAVGLQQSNAPVAAHLPRAAAARRGLTSLPPQAQGPISSALGADQAAYRVGTSGGQLHATTPSAHLSSSFTGEGVELSTGSTRLGLHLAALGYGSALRGVAPATPHAERNRVTYAHPSVEEWYANGPLGLEQGFTLAKAPPRAGDGPLRVSLALSGNARAVLDPGAQSVSFLHGKQTALSYSGLRVTDARGREIPSSLALGHGRLSILVRDRGARYPLQIDPFVQDGGKLTPTDPIGSSSQFGYSVALSADGSTALIGAPTDNVLKGAAWVFTRSGLTWTQQAKLLPAPADREEGQFGETREGEFGSSVALSEDGSTALISAPGDLENEGAVWIFKRSGPTWSQQGNPVIAEYGEGGGETPFESAESEFGTSVSLSADGNTGLVGAPGAEGNEGAVLAIGHKGTAWAITAELIPSDEGSPFRSFFGSAVSLSADGKTALIGGPRDVVGGQMVGAAWIFTKPGSSWTQQGSKFTGSEVLGTNPQFGAAVALSGDASTALIGAPAEDGGVGAAWAYIGSGSEYSQQGPKLTASGESGAGHFGQSLALSPDGDEALIGAPADSAEAGAAWQFTRSEGTWSQGEELIAQGRPAPALFGHGLALSGDGETALLGAPRENGSAGSIRAFVTAPLPVTVTGTASPIEKTSATLNATVNPNGEEVSECEFEYGTSASYGHSVPCSSPPGSGTSPVAVSAPIAELTPGTTYHFRIIATNATGTNVGADATFLSLPEAPSIVTGNASSVTASSAVLNGTVDPNRGEVTSCAFEYGPSSGEYEASVPCSPSPGAGDSPVAVSGSIAGLSSGMSYRFRVVATNAGGTSHGEGKTFVAQSGPPEFGICAKVAVGAGPYGNNACTKTTGKHDYDWSNSAVAGTTFTTKLASGIVKLSTVAKPSRIECTGESGSGEYTGSKNVGAVHFTLTGCHRGAAKCTGAAASAGEISTAPLEGVLGVERLGGTPVKDKLGLALYPVGHSGPVAEFTCESAAEVVTIQGSVIVPVKANKMLLTQTLSFKGSPGKQKPENFVEGGKQALEEQQGATNLGVVGLAMKLTLTNAQAVETNSVA